MSASVLKETFKGERASDLIPVLSFDDKSKIFLLDDKSIAFAFKIYPLGGADETINSRINNFLSTDWPANTTIQVSLYTSDNINNQMNGFLMKREGVAEPMFMKMAESRANFLQTATLKPTDPVSNSLVRNFSIVISIKLPLKDFEPTEGEYEKAADLQIMTNKNLSTIGLNPTILSRDDYVVMMDDILHHGETASWRDNFPRSADIDKPLNMQVLDWDKSIEVDEKGLWIGDQRVKTLGAKRYPDAVFPGFGVNYIGDIVTGARGLRGQFLFNFTIIFPDPQKARFSIDKKRTLTVAQATGPLQKFVPVLQHKAKGFNLLNDALDDGDRPVKVYLSVSVFGNSEEHATENATNVRSYLSEIGFQMIEDRFYVLPFFLNSLPFGADRQAVGDLFRYKTMATRHAAVLMPIFSDWRGTGTPVLNYISRNGQLMNMDLFDSNTNFNGVIAAASGAGKSFSTNYIISNYLAIGGKAWVIDVGRSYVKLCESFEGDFIHFGQDSDICLNPFEIVQDVEEESDMIMGLLAAMAAPNETLSDFQMQVMLEILLKLWEDIGKQLTIDHIQNELQKHEDSRVRDIGAQLFAFTSKGPYGKYFNGKNNVSFKNRFTVLELDDLQGREHLMQVVLLQLIYQIQQDMYLGEKDRPKLTIIDEAWSLLSNGNVGKFIENGFRRFRKYRGSAIVVTQSVRDLAESSVGRAIVENSSNMYLMKQKGDAIDALKDQKLLPIADGAYELLKTVHTAKGAYSETFFITEYGQGIGRLIVDPFQLLLYSTEPKDVHDIKMYTDEGDSVEQAIIKVMRDRNA